jgi:probable rRNA maturation factor
MLFVINWLKKLLTRMIKHMIKYNLICKSNHWPARVKKIENLIKILLKLKINLKFKNNINYTCNIILTETNFMKKINKKYKNANKDTDVLTFVSELNFKKQRKHKICDIFLSSQIIKKDAKNNEVNFYNHLGHLLTHSFLHINGYLHDNVSDFEKMKNIEIKILNKIGISNPYQQI